MDGIAAALKIKEKVGERTQAILQKGITPCLAVVLAGNDPSSCTYVEAKQKALAEAGMESRDFRLPENTGEEEILSIVERLNNDDSVHGILIQLPLPAHINSLKILSAINPDKDVDGFNSLYGNVSGTPGFMPCTPQGILFLLQEYNVPISGAHAVVVGRSNLVGRPLANLLSRPEHNATVTICHTSTKDLSRYTRDADILIAATGAPGLIKAEMVKEGAAVIDVGIKRIPDLSPKGYYLRGDVDGGVADKAGFLSPVPGGVGPMTIAMLVQNTAIAAERSCQINNQF
jgi:methylenetetrahydrofolate dehydrogenase (NADP+)/methenyltetrahydrofolate cyclohydrolase